MSPSLIPRPLQLEMGTGQFYLSRDTTISGDTELAHTAIEWFQLKCAKRCCGGYLLMAFPTRFSTRNCAVPMKR